jgi:PRTRC genetic system protein B
MTPILQLNVYQHTIKNESPITIEQYGETRKTDSYYIESHDIVEKKGEFIIDAGKPLTIQVLKEIAQLSAPELQKLLRPKILIPENMLYIDQRIGEQRLIWWEPAMLRKVKLLKEKLELFFPAILYCLMNKKLYVFAIVNERPKDKCALFHYPLWNIYTSHEVCMGSTKTTNKSLEYFDDVIESYTNGFWGSKFTHNSGPYKGKMGKIDESQFIKSKKFPTINHLISSDYEED